MTWPTSTTTTNKKGTCDNMGILDRFTSIMSSNVNALLDKMEDPSKMIDQTLRDLRENLAECKKDTAAVMADEAEAKRQLDKAKADVDKYTKAAMKAVEAGNDDDARTLIAKKQQCEADMANVQGVYDIAKANADKMRQMYDHLVEQIQSCESRKNAVKSKMNIAKAQNRINETTSKLGSSTASVSAFERAEAKANRMLDQAMAGAELDSKPADAAADLAEKYSGAGGSASVDDELAAMKQKLAGGGQ